MRFGRDSWDQAICFIKVTHAIFQIHATAAENFPLQSIEHLLQIPELTIKNTGIPSDNRIPHFCE